MGKSFNKQKCLILGHSTGMLNTVPRYTVPNAPEP